MVDQLYPFGLYNNVMMKDVWKTQRDTMSTTIAIPKNLAQLKKYLQPGVNLNLVKAPYIPEGGSPLARTVNIVRTNEITMNNGATLVFLGAKFYQFDEKGFNACREIGGKMETVLRYEYVIEQ